MLSLFVSTFLLFGVLAPYINIHSPQIIFYTNSGYIPNYRNIEKGEVLYFVNISQYPMWTASDPHPIHTDYSFFDSHRPYSYGEIYPFQFPDTGTYAWHNHDKSNHRGIVRVYDPKNPLISIDKTKKELQETRDRFLAMLDPQDDTTISHMISTLESDAKLSRNCHDMAHDLGHHAYELYGFSRAMTFGTGIQNTSVDDICAGGYMHGILEELFLHHPELEKNPENVCAHIPEEHNGSCYHGVGHGIMFSVKRDVPKALVACRTLSSLTYTYRCFEGVWMEMFWGDTGHTGADLLGWEKNNPFGRCVQANTDEKPTCYLYAHLGYLRYHPGDYSGVIRFCTFGNISKYDSNFCLKGVGITLMKHFTSHHLEETEKLTKTLTYTQKYAYYEGVIGYSLLSNVSRTKLTHFCSLLSRDGEVCREVLKNTQ